MTKREWNAFGRLLLPINLGGSRTLAPKLAEKLLALGYVRPFEELIYGSGTSPIDRIPVRVRGYEMTPQGNVAYCEWASENCEED